MLQLNHLKASKLQITTVCVEALNSETLDVIEKARIL